MPFILKGLKFNYNKNYIPEQEDIFSHFGIDDDSPIEGQVKNFNNNPNDKRKFDSMKHRWVDVEDEYQPSIFEGEPIIKRSKKGDILNDVKINPKNYSVAGIVDGAWNGEITVENGKIKTKAREFKGEGKRDPSYWENSDETNRKLRWCLVIKNNKTDEHIVVSRDGAIRLLHPQLWNKISNNNGNAVENIFSMFSLLPAEVQISNIYELAKGEQNTPEGMKNKMIVFNKDKVDKEYPYKQILNVNFSQFQDKNNKELTKTGISKMPVLKNSIESNVWILNNEIEKRIKQKGLELNKENINDTIEELQEEKYLEKYYKLVEQDDSKKKAIPQTETEEFKKWFGNSKVVDKNGKPLVVYHGSPNKFNEFRLDKVGSVTDGGIYGKGFYFTPNKNIAYEYKGYGSLYEAYLRLENPLLHDGETPEWYINHKKYFVNKTNDESRESLITDGYDGVISLSNGKIQQYIAFYPNQIKSATDNNGNFDINSNDITKSEGLRMETIKLFNKSIKLNKKINLAEGTEIEKEHEDLYNELNERLKDEGIKMPMSKEEFFTRIAVVHLDETEDYYKLLKKYIGKSHTDIKLFGKDFEILKANKTAYSQYDSSIFGGSPFDKKTKGDKAIQGESAGGAAKISREGETKQGKGGLLKLSKDPSGKGAHWRLTDKKQSDKESGDQTADEPKGKDVTRTVIRRLNENPFSKCSIFDKEGNLTYTGMLVSAQEGMNNDVEFIFRHEDGLFTLPISKNKFHATQADKIITIENKKGDKILIDTSKYEGITGTGHNNTPITGDDQIPFEDIKELVANEYLKNQYDYVSEAKGLAYTANKRQHIVRGEFNQIADKLDVHRSFTAKTIDELAEEIEMNERYGEAHKNDDLVIYEAEMMINDYAQYESLLSEFKQKGYEIKDVQDGFKNHSEPGYTDITVTMQKGDDKSTLTEVRFITPQLFLKRSDFGVHLNKVVRNIDKLEKKYRGSGMLKDVLPEIKENAMKVINKYYEEAYYSDFRPSKSDKPTFKQSNMSAWDDDSPVSFDREIKSLRGILNKIIQPLLAASVNFSGLNPYSPDSSSIVDDTVKDIVKPIKDIEKKYTSKIINLFKSLKQYYKNR